MGVNVASIAVVSPPTTVVYVYGVSKSVPVAAGESTGPCAGVVAVVRVVVPRVVVPVVAVPVVMPVVGTTAPVSVVLE